jgi:uncharacterized protein YjiS (DUF1127 family)
MTQHILVLSNYLLSPIEGLVSFLKDWNAGYQRNKMVKATIKQLSALSDRELNDIGIGRGDIRSVAKGDETLKRTAAYPNDNLKGWV